jgi:hypothetical protein
MEALDRKMAGLMAMHDWLFPADRVEKQVRLQAAIADLENDLEPLSKGRQLHIYTTSTAL